MGRTRRRCVIYGCESDSTKHEDLKFFKFLSKGNPLYSAWLSLCKGSAKLISAHPCPFICSRHFYEHDIGQKGLYKDALPSLFLLAPTGLKPAVLSEEEIASLHNKEKLRVAETDDLMEGGAHCNKYKTFADYSGHSSFDVKSESNDSMEPRPNDDDDGEEAKDIENKTNTTDEIVTSEVKTEGNDDWIELSMKDEVDGESDIENRQTDTKDEIVIDSYQQALELLEPLEDYALRTERYKAFGLLMTLETIFNNPKTDSDP